MAKQIFQTKKQEVCTGSLPVQAPFDIIILCYLSFCYKFPYQRLLRSLAAAGASTEKSITAASTDTLSQPTFSSASTKDL